VFKTCLFIPISHFLQFSFQSPISQSPNLYFITFSLLTSRLLSHSPSTGISVRSWNFDLAFLGLDYYFVPRIPTSRTSPITTFRQIWLARVQAISRIFLKKFILTIGISPPCPTAARRNHNDFSRLTKISWLRDFRPFVFFIPRLFSLWFQASRSSLLLPLKANPIFLRMGIRGLVNKVWLVPHFYYFDPARHFIVIFVAFSEKRSHLDDSRFVFSFSTY